MALGTHPGGKLLDYEQFIDHQLGLTRARIKMTDVLTAGVTLAAAVLGVLFLEVVLDHLFGLPLLLRQVVFVFGMAAAVTFAAMRIVRPMVARVNGLYAAKTIEGVDPTFKNSLINYLELRKRRGEMPKSVLAAVEAKAVDDLAKVEVDSVVNQRRLVQTIYALSGIVVALCLYSILTPKSISDSVGRAFLADLARPTNTRIVNIRPGDDPKLATVAASSTVKFAADVKGARPKAMTLHYSTDGGTNYLRKEMTNVKFDTWAADLENVQQSMTYYLTAGDGVSRDYHLEVRPEPMVTEIRHDLDYPEYTKAARRAGVEGGNVEALEGTIVTLHARTNDPVDRAWVEMTHPDPSAKGGGRKTEEIQADVEEADAKAITAKFKVTTTGQFKIRFKTTGGLQNQHPTLHDLKAYKDNPPLAQFSRPDKPEIKAPANAKVPLRFKATDDFGVRDATLYVAQIRSRRPANGEAPAPVIKGEALQPPKNYLERKEPTRELVQDDVIDLESLRVKPGAMIEYYLVVRDTRTPHANKIETQHQTIEVGEPASKKELEKVEKPKPDEAQQPADEPEAGDRPDNPQDQPAKEPPAAQKPKEGTPKDQADPKVKPNGNPQDGKQGDANEGGQAQQPPKELTEKEKQLIAKLDRNRPRKPNPGNRQGSDKPNPKDAAQQNNGQGGDSSPKSNGENAQENNGATPPPANGSKPNPPQDQVARGKENDNQDPQGGQKPDPTQVARGNPNGEGNPGGKPQPNNTQQQASKPGEKKAGDTSGKTGDPSQGAMPKNAGEKPTKPDGTTGTGSDANANGKKPEPGQAGKPDSNKPREGATPSGDPKNGASGKPNPAKANDANSKGADNQGGNAAKPKTGEGAKNGSDLAMNPERNPQAPRPGEGVKPQPTKPNEGSNAGGTNAAGKSQSDNSGMANNGKTKDGSSASQQPGKTDESQGIKPQGTKPGENPSAPQADKTGEPAGTKPQPGKTNEPQAGNTKEQAGKPDPSNPEAGKSGEANEKANNGAASQKNSGKEGEAQPKAGNAGKPNAEGSKSGDPSAKNANGASGKTPDAKNGEKGVKPQPGGSNDLAMKKDGGPNGQPKDAAKPGQGESGKTGEKNAGNSGASPDKSKADGSKPGGSQKGETEPGAKKNGENGPAKPDESGKKPSEGAGAQDGAKPDPSQAGKPNGDGSKSGEGAQKSGDPKTAKPNPDGAKPGNPADGANNPADPTARKPGDPQAKEPADGAMSNGDTPKNPGGKPQPDKDKPSADNAGNNANGSQSGDGKQGKPGQKPGENPEGQPTDANGGKQPSDKDGNAPGGKPSENATDQPKDAASQAGKPGQNDAKDANAMKPGAGEKPGNPASAQQKPAQAGDGAAKPGKTPSGKPGQDANKPPQGANKPAEAAPKPGEPGANPSLTQKPDGSTGKQGDEPGQAGERGQKPGQGEKADGKDGSGKSMAGSKPGNTPGSKPGQNATAKSSDGSGKDGDAAGDSKSASGKPGEAGSKPGEAGAKPGDGAGKPGEAQGGQPGQEGGQPGGQPGSGQAQGDGQEQGGEGQQGGQQPGQGSKPGEGGQPGSQPGEGKQPGGAASKNAGGGGRDGGETSPIQTEKLEKNQFDRKAEPKAGDDVAPKGADQTSMALREVQDLLRAGKSTKALEEETGMTRQELEQFVKKFEKVEKPQAEPGRDLTGDLGKDRVLDPNRKIGDPVRQNTNSGRASRGPGATVQDNLAGDTEGSRSAVPPEYRARLDAYRASFSKAGTARPASTPKASAPKR